MSPFRRLARFVSTAALALVAGNAVGQTSDCAVHQGNSRSLLPQNSANISYLATSNDARYLYGLTQFGWVRAPLSNPMNPSPLSLGQHGLKFSNGGVVPMVCDCWQMGTTMAFAEDPTGSARVFFDNNAATQGGGLAGQVGKADGAGFAQFGQQIDILNYTIGVGVGAIHLPVSGKFIGYVPSDSGVQVIDATTVTGDPSASAALRPVGSLNWTGFVRLQAAHVQVPSLAYDKYLLVGGLALSRQIRVAEIDPSTGIPVQKASLASIGEPNTLDVATVGNRIFIFSAEGSAGLNIYEYTPSQFGGTLTHARNIPGSINPAVVRGGQFPAIFMHRDATPFQSFIDVYDTKFLTQGGQPRKAYSLPHAGAPQEAGVSPGFLGRAVDAKVVTNGPVVTAYVYRLVQKRTGEGEDSVRTDKLDISCISADLTTPPSASASLVNLSAQARSGVEATRKYFGDRWHIRDTSSTGAPLDQIEWDFNVVSGQFAPNESGVLPGPISEVNPAYFPCDPSSNGNIRTGANCHVSLGSPASGSFSIGNRTKNANGWSANTFISAGQNVIAPQAIVAGYDGATLRVLSGGQASASGSQGNLTDATAAWVFNPGGVALSGFSVAVPSGATSFSMDVIYRGGYVSRVSGAVQQVDLVPDFTLTSPVVRSNPVTLTNRMQIGPAATLNSVEYAVDQNPGDPASYTGSLLGSFLPINGTATINAPATVGSYYVHLRYNYTAGIARTVTITKPMSVINQLVLTVTGPATANTGQQVSFTVNGGGPSTTYAWNWGDCPFCNPPYLSGPATNTHVYTNPGPFIVTVRASDPSAPDAFPTATIDISGPPPPTPPPPTPPPTPPPPPPPPSGFSVALTGAASGTSGSPVTFSAVASGGTGTVSYAWRWGDNALSLNYIPGPATNSYTYAAPGQFTVSVRATDGVGNQATGSASVSIGAPSGPPLNLSISGPPRGRKDQAVPFTTSVSGGVPPYTYAWRWGDSAFGVFVTGPANHSHAYGALGQFNVSVRVTDSVGQGVTATTSLTIDAAFQALIVPGAAWLNSGTDVWATDISVANPGAEPLSLAVAFLPYLTDSPGSVDLSTLTYRAIDTPLAPSGGSWSQTNIVQWLGGQPTDKGTLVLRYEGPVPVVNGRVYFARGSNPLGPAYGAPVEAFKADQGGRVLAPASTTPRGVEAGLEQTLIGLRSTDLYRFGVTLYNSSGVETRAELRAFDETGTPVEINSDDAGTRGTVREVRIRPYQQIYLRNQDLGLPQHPNKRYVFRANKIGADGSLVAFGAAIDTKTSDLEQFTDDTPPAVSDEQGSVYLYIPGASRFDSGNGAKWRTELRAYNPANVERTLTVEYLFVGAGEPETISSATLRVGAGKLVAADDVIGSVMDDFTPHDLKTLSTTGLLRIRYSPEVPGSPMVFSARNYDDQVAGTTGTQLSVYSRREGVSVGEPSIYVPGAQEDTGEQARLRTTLGVFAMDNRQTRVRVSAVKRDGTVLPNGTHEFVLNQPGASGHMSQIFLPAIAGIVSNEAMTIKTEVLEGGRAGVYVVTVDTNTRDTSFKPGRPGR